MGARSLWWMIIEWNDAPDSSFQTLASRNPPFSKLPNSSRVCRIESAHPFKVSTLLEAQHSC